MERVSCAKCGAEIKYVAMHDKTVVVDLEYTEVITDRGRIIEGHLRHKCQGNRDTQTPGTGA